ncbi:YqiA/YcfP family alpha/beta fold hydrolase [Thiomicrorhabdus sp. Milos-T2]|uniref:YqiA/YcfP family alpha/beta fold hydrolase n=1 Tax=Thiomicrorhabdus sp. Milos-T2 TaxID=90814 RepID=UPI00049429C6|nr:YqiA/YcfP family alpha/beta fold hydrolase [Thiomicrorhabdus sp. Milos-T2]
MQDCIGVYLHGFLSSGNSEKGQWLKSKVKQNSSCFKDVYTPTYPIASPQASVEEINRCIQHALSLSSKVILLGSSMGGYYAQYFGQKYAIPYIMINPALNPTPIFTQNLGSHINPATEEAFCIDAAYIEAIQSFNFSDLQQNIPALLLLDTDDEVIDVEFALQRYAQSYVKSHECKAGIDQNSKFESIIFTGGDHRFIHMDTAWLDIQAFAERL